MPTRFPQRPQSHRLEDESIAFLMRHLPHDWTCDRPQHDYGVDMRLGLASAGQVNGHQLVVQLKSSSSEPAGATVAVRLDVSSLNLLRNMLEVALLVKYVSTESEAYWLLLKDFAAHPLDGQKTITVRIPRANRVSASPWIQIARYVEAVHVRKLHANFPTT